MACLAGISRAFLFLPSSLSLLEVSSLTITGTFLMRKLVPELKMFISGTDAYTYFNVEGVFISGKWHVTISEAS
jgi:hypothetical protein